MSTASARNRSVRATRTNDGGGSGPASAPGGPRGHGEAGAERGGQAVQRGERRVAPAVLEVRDVGHREPGVDGDGGHRASALRSRDFRLLWGAGLVSELGSWLLVVAVPAQVLAETGSLLATGLVLGAEYLPFLLFGPAAGALADRVDRRTLLIAADLVRAVAVTALLCTGLAPCVVYVAVFVESAATTVARPARPCCS